MDKEEIKQTTIQTPMELYDTIEKYRETPDMRNFLMKSQHWESSPILLTDSLKHKLFYTSKYYLEYRKIAMRLRCSNLAFPELPKETDIPRICLDELQEWCINCKSEPETGLQPNVNVNIYGDVQAGNLQIAHDASIHEQPIAKEKKKGSIKKLLKIIVAIPTFIAAVLAILHYLGLLEPIKTFISKILWPK
jgi:predicted nucleotidyltransferase